MKADTRLTQIQLFPTPIKHEYFIVILYHINGCCAAPINKTQLSHQKKKKGPNYKL